MIRHNRFHQCFLKFFGNDFIKRFEMYSFRALFAWGMYIIGYLCIKIVLCFLTGIFFTQSTQTSKRSTHVTYSFRSNFNFCSMKHVLGNFQSCFIFQNYPIFFSLDIVAIFFLLKLTHPTLSYDFSLF